MNEFTAVVTREDDVWLAEVPGLPGGRSFAGSLESLRRELTDAVILAADLPDDAPVRVRFTSGPGLTGKLAEAFDLADERGEIASRTAQLTARTAALAVDLVDSGLSLRDTAAALGVTSGRISQLTRARAG